MGFIPNQKNAIVTIVEGYCELAKEDRSKSSVSLLTRILLARPHKVDRWITNQNIADMDLRQTAARHRCRTVQPLHAERHLAWRVNLWMLGYKGRE